MENQALFIYFHPKSSLNSSPTPFLKTGHTLIFLFFPLFFFLAGLFVCTYAYTCVIQFYMCDEKHKQKKIEIFMCPEISVLLSKFFSEVPSTFLIILAALGKNVFRGRYVAYKASLTASTSYNVLHYFFCNCC